MLFSIQRADWSLWGDSKSLRRYKPWENRSCTRILNEKINKYATAINLTESLFLISNQSLFPTFFRDFFFSLSLSQLMAPLTADELTQQDNTKQFKISDPQTLTPVSLRAQAPSNSLPWSLPCAFHDERQLRGLTEAGLTFTHSSQPSAANQLKNKKNKKKQQNTRRDGGGKKNNNNNKKKSNLSRVGSILFENLVSASESARRVSKIQHGVVE